MGRVIVLLRCDLCGRLVEKKKLRRVSAVELPLCDRCFLRVHRGNLGRRI